MLDLVKRVPYFSSLSRKDLELLVERSKLKRLKKGEILFEEGSIARNAYVILEGKLGVFKTADGREVLLAVRKKGAIIGELALLKETTRTASIRAKTPAALLCIDKSEFDRILAASPTIVHALFATVMDRLEATEAMLRQSEKMSQIGMLSAGLAHELNNPAAAVQRGAEQIQRLWEPFQETLRLLLSLQLTKEKTGKLRELAARTLSVARQPAGNDLVAFEDEEKIEKLLTGFGVGSAWELAPNLVKIGFSTDKIRKLATFFGRRELGHVLAYLSMLYEYSILFSEVHLGAQRISEIVTALSSYAYLDQAPVQSVDIHQGIENTLIVLRHQLKDGIIIKKQYDKALPVIEGYGSELNQVWTNIIDNAIDAMDGKGILTITTAHSHREVIVEIADTGPGIPETVQSKIFDPFFSTKPVGEGKGVGLHISYNIVAFKHGGEITVRSKPGETVFRISLPRTFKRK